MMIALALKFLNRHWAEAVSQLLDRCPDSFGLAVFNPCWTSPGDGASTPRLEARGRVLRSGRIGTTPTGHLVSVWPKSAVRF